MTPEDFKRSLRAQGKTIRQWAEENNFDPTGVYRLLRGQDRGNYGQAHEIAVAAGIKPLAGGRHDAVTAVNSSRMASDFTDSIRKSVSNGR
ncbi:MAG: hypothetical protein AMXMBFR6_11730 [Betaproteobacteria bacterium]